MPRSNWKGVISFGLVTIPVVLYPSENKGYKISFHQIDKRDNARIKYQRINVDTGKEVPWTDITRGYEYDEDTTVPVPDEVLKKVAGEKSRTIDIETFINQDDLDFMTLENVYYLVPDKNGDKGYVILRDALQETKKIGIAKVIISTKEYLAAVMPHDKALILCLLKYDNEVRKPDEFDLPTKEPTAYKVNKKEMEVAKQLIKSMSSKWKPEKYVDEYQSAIHKWIEEDLQNIPHKVASPSKHARGNVVNFVDLLKKSLETKGKTTNGKKKTTVKPHKIAKTKSKAARHHSTRH